MPARKTAPISLGSTAASETIRKPDRIFDDVEEVPRIPLNDGRILAVQRERYVSGEHGPMMLALIRANNTGGESASRVLLGDIQRAVVAAKTAGITLVG